MTTVFLSRPNWLPPRYERFMQPFHDILRKLDFVPKTIGKNVAALSSPFEEVTDLMVKCECTIVLGFPQITMKSGDLKGVPIETPMTMPTEWNHIEAAMSLMLKKPTLMILGPNVVPRGVFERGAANVFVHRIERMKPAWADEMIPQLGALKSKVEA